MPQLEQDIGPLAILRLDADMYESTMVVLEHLYTKLAIGGYVIFDDWGMIQGCDQAVADFRSRNGITEAIEVIGYVKGKPLGAFWRKARQH